MSVRNLGYLFAPRSVAVIGASDREGSVGRVLADNMLGGGFDGTIRLVNPGHDEVRGQHAYHDVGDLPEAPDMAVVATPAAAVPGIIESLGERGTRAAVVIGAGFAESREEKGARLQQAMLDAARPHLLRIIGPNCLGVLAPGAGVNASFAQAHAIPGKLAFVAQSGAITASLLDWANARGIGFSHMVSLGDMADVDFGDMLDYLASDRHTSAVLLYIEGITHARKFMSAARACARAKPVILVKAGRHAAGARAASSHTGAMAGSDEVFEAAFRRAGMLRVHGLDELFDAAEILALSRVPRGPRIAILTNGGGMGVLAADEVVDEGGELAELSQETLDALDGVLPETWSYGNPVDIIGDAPGSRYVAAMDALVQDRGVDAVLALNCPTGVSSSTDAARALIDSRDGWGGVPVLTAWTGNGTAAKARRMFREHGVPSYETPAQAVRAFMHMIRYRHSQEALTETPPSIPETFGPDVSAARRTVRDALEAGREWLDQEAVEKVLKAYDIPTVSVRRVADAEAAVAAAGELDGPVALKIRSPDIQHKTDVGGVALDLPDAEAVRDAAAAMLQRVSERAPEARIEGFQVEPMIRRRDAFELIVGIATDPLFGPVVLFGQGGTAVEVIDDKALGLPPLNMKLARELMAATRVHRLLSGYRGHAAADRDAVALILIRIAQLAADVPELAELDINPLLADADGALAVDARIRAAVPEDKDRLAIRPYPRELEETVTLGSGRRLLLLRPIRPEDEPALRETFGKLTREEMRMRFFVPFKQLSHVLGARFTQIDYDREMALVLADPGPAGEAEIHAVVRLHVDPDNERGEYSILVRHEMAGLGLGPMLLRRIIDYARDRGLQEVYGNVLPGNKTMLRLCEAFGFDVRRDPEDPMLMRVSLAL